MTNASTFRAATVDTSLLPEQDREEAWRRLAAPHFELSDMASGLPARAQVVQTGGIAHIDAIYPRHAITRDPERIRRDQADAILCSIDLRPGCTTVVEGKPAEGGVGEVIFADLARPGTKLCEPGRTLCVVVQRDALRPYVREPERVLEAPPSGLRPLLADFIRLIQRTRTTITADTAGHVERAFLELVGACAAAPESVERSRGTRDQLMLARAIAFIDRSLSNPDLSPAALSEHLQVSRSTLYRLFDEAGGVGACVRERRLLRAHELLEARTSRVRVQNVAFSTGFRSEAQFSRAFRQRFGVAPRDVAPVDWRAADIVPRRPKMPLAAP